MPCSPLSARKNVFWDFDGTLADTEADIKDAWRRTIASLALPAEPFERLYVTGPAIDDMVRRMWPERASAELIGAVRASFVTSYDTGGFPKTKLYAGVSEMLAHLRRAGRRMFIATNKRYVAIRAIVRAMNLAETFEDVLATDMFQDTPLGKMSKGALLREIMARRGLDPSETAIVGDTHLDIEAGHDAGIATVGVTWGYGTRAELVQAHADAIVYSPAELTAKE